MGAEFGKELFNPDSLPFLTVTHPAVTELLKKEGVTLLHDNPLRRTLLQVTDSKVSRIPGEHFGYLKLGIEPTTLMRRIANRFERPVLLHDYYGPRICLPLQYCHSWLTMVHSPYYMSDPFHMKIETIKGWEQSLLDIEEGTFVPHVTDRGVHCIIIGGAKENEFYMVPGWQSGLEHAHGLFGISHQVASDGQAEKLMLGYAEACRPTMPYFPSADQLTLSFNEIKTIRAHLAGMSQEQNAHMWAPSTVP